MIHHPQSPILQVRQHLTPFLLLILLALTLITGILGAPAPAWAEDYNQMTLMEVDFSGQDLTNSSFTQATLRKSNLSHTNLQGVSLFGANLDRVNLEGANLRYATLDNARLTSANLTNAVLEGAFAYNTKFNGAIIDGADFTDVFLQPRMVETLCEIASGTNPETGRETRATLYCD